MNPIIPLNHFSSINLPFSSLFSLVVVLIGVLLDLVLSIPNFLRMFLAYLVWLMKITFLMLPLAIINLDFDLNKLNFEHLICLFGVCRNLFIFSEVYYPENIPNLSRANWSQKYIFRLTRSLRFREAFTILRGF